MKRYRGLTLNLLFTLAMSCGSSQAFFSPSLGTISGLVKGLQQVAIGMMVLWGGHAALPLDDGIPFFLQTIEYHRNYVYNIEMTSDGSVMLGGYMYNDTLLDQSYLIKYSSDYSMQWMTHVGDELFERSFRMAILNDDSIVLGGLMRNQQFRYSGWFVRFDSNDGHVIWQKVLNMSVDSYVDGAVPTQDGGFAITSYASPNLFSAKTNAIFATYTKEGQRQIMYLMEADFDLGGLPLEQIGPEDFIVVGHARLPIGGNSYLSIIRFHVQNGVVWKKYVESPTGERVTAITISNEGTVLISVNTLVGQPVVIIYEFSFDGVLLSRKKNLEASYVDNIITTSGEGFAITGYNPYSILIKEATFTVFNSSGPAWGIIIERSETNRGTSIYQKSDGSFLIAGHGIVEEGSFFGKISDALHTGGCVTPYMPIFVESMGEVVVKNATHINVTEVFYTTEDLNHTQHFTTPNESIVCFTTAAPTMNTLSPTLSTPSPSSFPTSASPSSTPSRTPTRQPTLATKSPTKSPTKNFRPQIIGNISDQKAVVDKFFTYHLKVNEVFSDDQDDVEELHISTSQVGLFGSLPRWLKFNQTTKDYTGTPKAKFNHPIRVNILDTKGAKAEKDVLFTIKVVDEPTDNTVIYALLGTLCGLVFLAIAIGGIMMSRAKTSKRKQSTNQTKENTESKTKLKKQTEARSKRNPYKRPKSNTTKMEMDAQISMNAEMYAKINADIEMDVFIGHHGVTAYGFYDEGAID